MLSIHMGTLRLGWEGRGGGGGKEVEVVTFVPKNLSNMAKCLSVKGGATNALKLHETALFCNVFF